MQIRMISVRVRTQKDSAEGVGMLIRVYQTHAELARSFEKDLDTPKYTEYTVTVYGT